MRAAFVYPNPRQELVARVARGEAPDTNLLGQNHLVELGIDAFVHDSVLRRRHSAGGAVDRLRWHGRELTLPWELRNADVVVTPLHTLLPLAAAVCRRPRTVILSYGVVAAWQRAGGARRRLLGASLRASAAVVAISREGRDRLVAETGLDERRAHVATLGVDERWWHPAPPAPDGHVLTVGRDFARDYGTFARALEGTGLRGVILCKEENLRGVRVPPNVEVRLNVSPAEVRELYAGASCVVVPTHADTDPRGTENSGTISLLEAMASRRPTVVTERRYLRDYLHEDASATVQPADPAALRDAVEAIAGDGERARAMGEAARAHVEAGHTTRHLAERLAAVLREVA